MKKYLLDISQNSLLNLGFVSNGSLRIFFNNLSKGELTRDSVMEKMCLFDFGMCESEMIFGYSGNTVKEKRKEETFLMLVEAKEIDTLNCICFKNENYPDATIKKYNREGKYGLEVLTILEISGKDLGLCDKIKENIVSEISGVELFEEYNLASNKINEIFESEDYERMYDLCYVLNIPMNETSRKHWINVINVVDLHKSSKNIGHITQKQFFEALGELEEEIDQEKYFKQFLVFEKWFSTTFGLLKSSREDYLYQKAEQLKQAKKLLDLNLFY